MRNVTTLMTAMVGIAVLAAAPAAGQPVAIKFDTELTSLEAQGGPYAVPLAADPGNLLGDSVDGYGFVNSEVLITLSSQRTIGPAGPATLGQTTAVQGGAQFQTAGLPINGVTTLPPIDPEQLDGEPFFVDSFFDVYFDIKITDVDRRPGRDYAGQPDGAFLFLPDLGPVAMRSTYQVTFDKTADNFGLLPPPEGSPYIMDIAEYEVPLGGDINGNGENDKIKITGATLTAMDANRTFDPGPNGSVLFGFTGVVDLEGGVMDESTDPPFTIGGLSGPTTGWGQIQNPPEPTTMALLAVGGTLLVRRRRRKR